MSNWRKRRRQERRDDRRKRRSVRRTARRTASVLSTDVKRRMERNIQGATIDQKAADQATRKAKALGIANTVSGTAMKAATPAVASAAGLSTAAAAGTASLAAAFPIGTIIVAVPLAIGLGMSAASSAKKNRAKYLTQDQKKLLQMIKKYKKKTQTWRIEKSKKLLKSYDKHLAKGNLRTLGLFDGDKRRKEELKWKGKKAKIEMQLTAIYMAEFETQPPKKQSTSTKIKSQKIIRNIQKKQKASIDPKVSALTFSQSGKLLFDKPLMVRQTARVLQRPDEQTRLINQAPPAPPQSVLTTLQQHPGAVPDIVVEEESDGTLGAVLTGVGIGGLVLVSSIFI